jgi:hypothetical protein
LLLHRPGLAWYCAATETLVGHHFVPLVGGDQSPSHVLVSPRPERGGGLVAGARASAGVDGAQAAESRLAEEDYYYYGIGSDF